MLSSRCWAKAAKVELLSYLVLVEAANSIKMLVYCCQAKFGKKAKVVKPKQPRQRIVPQIALSERVAKLTGSAKYV